MHKTHWKVQLSNGETAEEFKGDYKEIKNKLSPWQRLVKFANKKDLSISLIQIRYKDRRWTLPRGAKEYYYRRFISRVLGEKNEKHYIIIGAVFGFGELQIWVNEDNPNIMFSKKINYE